MLREFDDGRKLVCRRLNEIGGSIGALPKGIFYAFPNTNGFRLPSQEFAELPVKNAGIMTAPGSAFGENGEGHIRISYATSREKLEGSLNRTEEAVRAINQIGSESFRVFFQLVKQLWTQVP
jgi:aspartate/methionine/tyrosine aminotransferase